jgi:hypothetical protein
MEQGSARFHRVGAAMASTGQALAKVKELFEETECEWLVPQTAAIAPVSWPNRPERTMKPALDHVALVEDSNGRIKLPLENAEF